MQDTGLGAIAWGKAAEDRGPTEQVVGEEVDEAMAMDEQVAAGVFAPVVGLDIGDICWMPGDPVGGVGVDGDDQGGGANGDRTPGN